MTKTYTEMISYQDYADRLEYLLLYSQIGDPTFGQDRYINQHFYNSYKWQKFRRQIILRDQGCDLAHPDFPISKGTKLLIHHINPITLEDLINERPCLTDPDNAVCVAFMTHQAIHFANKDMILSRNPIERQPNDTIPWR